MDYRLVAAELAADVKSRDAIIADLEKQLIDEKREHAKTKLQVQAIKQDKMRIEAAYRAEVYNYRFPRIPTHAIAAPRLTIHSSKVSAQIAAHNSIGTVVHSKMTSGRSTACAMKGWGCADGALQDLQAVHAARP